jgi:hypothetical protein
MMFKLEVLLWLLGKKYADQNSKEAWSIKSGFTKEDLTP